jgi:hypothetical protein
MERALRAGLAALSVAAALAFIAMAAARLAYPFALDPAEGAWMDELGRLTRGQALYAEPSLEYVPLPELPGFVLVAAPFAQAFGADLAVLRLISLIASFGIAWLVFRAVRRETGNAVLGLVGAGVLLGSCTVVGRLDVARPEALAWFLAVAGLTVLRFTPGSKGALVAGLSLAAASLTSHHAVWFALGAAVHLGVNEPRRLLPFGLVVALVVAGGAVLLARWLGPWFSFYNVDLVVHGLRPDSNGLALATGLVGSLGPLGFSVLLAASLPAPLWRGPGGLWAWATVAGVAATFVGALEPRATSPGLGPALVPLAIAGPIAVVRVVSHLAAWPGSGRAGRSWVLYGALLLQFVPLAHGMSHQFPDPRGRQAHAWLIERLRALPGPVLVPGFGQAAASAGKGSSFNPLALEVLVEARGNRLLQRDPGFVGRMFAPLSRGGAGRPALVMVEALEQVGGSSDMPWASVARAYQRTDEWRELSDTPAPRFVYEPREAPAASETGLETPVPAGEPIADAHAR